MNKGFTFAELMISLVIIAVITAILYPTISEIAPNNNKHLFKSAYKTVEMVTSEIVNENDTGKLIPSGNYTDGGAVNLNYDTAADGDKPAVGAQIICREFKSKLNTLSFSSTDCVGTCTGCDQTANGYWFTTSNGMRWYFKDYVEGNPGEEEIFIDVNASNNSSDFESTNGPDDDGAGVQNPNKIGSAEWDHGMFRNDDQVVRDTFQIKISADGKVSLGDNEGIGLDHLKEKSK